MKQGSYTHQADRSFDRLGDRGYIFQVETLFIHLTSRRGRGRAGRQAGQFSESDTVGLAHLGQS